MTIGLILLGVLAVLIFFGAAERYFDALGVTSWLAFIIIISLVLGAIIPDIKMGAVSVSIGGFIVPIIIAVILIAIARKSDNVWRAVPAMLLSALVCGGLRLVINPGGTDGVLMCSLLVGFIGGAAAFLVSDSRLIMLASAIGGIVMGDIVSASVHFGNASASMLALGANGIFDAIIIACAFSLVMFETVSALKRAHLSKAAKRTLATEAAEDVVLDDIADQGDKPSSKDIFEYLDD